MHFIHPCAQWMSTPGRSFILEALSSGIDTTHWIGEPIDTAGGELLLQNNRDQTNLPPGTERSWPFTGVNNLKALVYHHQARRTRGEHYGGMMQMEEEIVAKEQQTGRRLCGLQLKPYCQDEWERRGSTTKKADATNCKLIWLLQTVVVRSSTSGCSFAVLASSFCHHIHLLLCGAIICKPPPTIFRGLN